MSRVTHFEIYAEDPAKLVEFYRTLLGWQIEKAPGIDYWRIRFRHYSLLPAVAQFRAPFTT